MVVYGYIRISTKAQSLERQKKNILNKYPRAKIIEEIFTGKKLVERVRLMNLVSKVKAGETIVFDSVSRMSRDAEDGVQLYFELLNRGVNLEFIKEPYINTDVYRERIKASKNIIVEDAQLNDTVMKGIREYLDEMAKNNIRIAFEQSEKEGKDISQRTVEGLRNARLNGKKLGGIPGKKRKSKKKEHAIAVIKEYNKLFGGKLNDVETMAMIKGLDEKLSVSRKTYYRYKAELLKEIILKEIDDENYLEKVLSRAEDKLEGVVDSSN